MPVVVGAPRSGTTLLRFMLDSHPLLTIPPETAFLPAVAELRQSGSVTAHDLFNLITTFPGDAPVWPDFDLSAREFREELGRLTPFDVSAGVRTFYSLYSSKQQKPRFGDKTPTYCVHMSAIERLLPEAHFIHIIRDGRDSSMSLRPLWFAPARDIASLARYWRYNVTTAREAGRSAGAYMEVRYEDLVTEPEPQLRSIGRFLDLPFDYSMLRYWERTPSRLREHKERVRLDGTVAVSQEQRRNQQLLVREPLQPSRAFQWKQQMNRSDRAEFLSHAGDLLVELGYEV